MDSRTRFWERATARRCVAMGGGVAAGLALGACIDPGSFVCTSSDQCGSGLAGVCHSSGACIYDDPDCASGRVWSPNAPDHGGECFSEDGGTTSTGASQSAEATSPATPSTTTADSGTSTSEGPSTTPEESSSSGTDPACGDGALDDGEGCDDGNEIDGDGCNRDCLPSGRVLWETEIEATAFDNCLHDVVVLSSGQIAAAGYAGNEAAESFTDSDQYEHLVATVNADGTMAAFVLGERDGRDELRCILEGADRTIWVGGERRTNDDYELWLGRLDGASFVTELSYAESETRGTVGQDCVALPGGGLLAAGMLDSGNSTGYDGWDRLLLYDPLDAGSAGSWVNHLPAKVPLRDVVYAATVLPDGRVVAAGSASTRADEGAKRWVALLDVAGVMVWEYVDGGAGAGQEEVYGVHVEGDRVFAVGATLFNQGDLARDWFGALDLETGALDYEERQGLEAPAILNDIAPAPDGDLFLSGRQGADAEGVVVRFDPGAGEARWVASLPNATRLHGVTADSEGHAIIVGSTVERGEDGPAYVARLAP